MQLTVYVPREGGAAEKMVHPKSGIVGKEQREGLVHCYYEGAVYGQANITCFADKLYHAASRLATRAPTVAQAAFDADDLVPVGTWDTALKALVEVTNPGALADWCGESPEAILAQGREAAKEYVPPPGRPGDEHENGWHDRFQLDGARIDVFARHHTRRRMPRGHEIARQTARGRGLEMVAERDFEWAVCRDGRHLCTLRQNQNGSYSAGSVPLGRPAGIREAAIAAVRRLCPPGDDAAPGPRR